MRRMQAKSCIREELTIGPRGEFAAEILAIFERENIRSQMCHPEGGTENRQLQYQLQLWMSEWTPGFQIRAERFPDTNVAAIRIKRRNVESEWMRPTNVGFGISHSLPIVLSGLLASEGGLLVVDNPESHLHPKGQLAMGQFLATLAASGVQVLIETHSDHILNGIRVAAKRGRINADDVAIYYFACSEDSEGTSIESPKLKQDGKLTKWPTGFFDQWQSALHELL